MGKHNSKEEPKIDMQLHMVGKPNKLLTYYTYKNEIVCNILPEEFSIFDYMAGIQVDHKMLFVSGGYNPDLNLIRKNFFSYNLETHEYEQLEDMNVERYTHTLQFNKYTNCIYAMGGRNYGNGEKGILNSCEKYNIETGTWQNIGNMNLRRATFFSIIYQRKIYVFGGYTGAKKRSKKIEMYDEINDKWNILNFKLNYGIEQGVLFQQSLDLYILGGQSKFGPTKKCQVVNFEIGKSDLCQFEILSERVLQKGIQVQNYIYQLFGDNENTIEKGCLGGFKKVDSSKFAILQQFKPEQFKAFCQVQFPIELSKQELYNSMSSQFIKNEIADSQIEKQRSSSINNSEIKTDENNKFKDIKNIIIILSNQICRIKFNPFVWVTYQLKETQQLFQFMNAARLSENTYIIIGGVSQKMNLINNKAYKLTFNDKKFQITNLSPIHFARYAFGITRTDEYIYIAGGRTYGGDDQGIMGSCERYLIQKNKWEVIQDLNQKRCSPLMFNYQNKIFIAGGYARYQTRLQSIEMYDTQVKQWFLIGIQLHRPIEAACLHLLERGDNKIDILVFGGRSQQDINEVTLYKINFNEPLDIQNNYQHWPSLPFSGSLLHKIEIDDNTLVILNSKNNQSEFCTYHYTIENDQLIGQMIQEHPITQQLEQLFNSDPQGLNNLGRFIIIQ